MISILFVMFVIVVVTGFVVVTDEKELADSKVNSYCGS
jgi:hypothetical protein